MLSTWREIYLVRARSTIQRRMSDATDQPPVLPGPGIVWEHIAAFSNSQLYGNAEALAAPGQLRQFARARQRAFRSMLSSIRRHSVTCNRVSTFAGDQGFDPLALWTRADDSQKLWLQEAELLHARWAMLGIVGCLVPEALALGGVDNIGEPVWWKAQTNSQKCLGDQLGESSAGTCAMPTMQLYTLVTRVLSACQYEVA